MRHWLLTSLLSALVVASLALCGVRKLHVPADEDLDSAADYVRARMKPNDVIIAWPHYMVGARQRLGDLPLIQPRQLEPDLLSRFARAHLVSIDAVGSGEQAAQVLATVGKLEQRERFGLVEVSSWDLGDAAEPIFDLWQQIRDLSVVAHYPDGTEAPCDRFSGERWICPRDQEWSYVGREMRSIGGEPRQCVWMHPLHAGGRLTIELPSLELDYDVALRGGFGFVDEAARRAAAPVRVRIQRGEEEVLGFEQPVAPGWRHVDERLGPSGEPIVIEISSSNNGAAHFCGTLTLVEDQS